MHVEADTVVTEVVAELLAVLARQADGVGEVRELLEVPGAPVHLPVFADLG